VTNLNNISQPCRWNEHDPPKHKYPSTTTQCQNPADHYKNITKTHTKIPSAVFLNSCFLWPLDSKNPLKMFIENWNEYGLLNGKKFWKGMSENNIFQFCIEIDLPFTRILFYTNSTLIINFHPWTTFQILPSLVTFTYS
jgi:hypothetical protein